MVLLVAIAMTTSGCATYKGARQARNAGIVSGVLGAAALAGAIAINQADDERCPSPPTGDECYADFDEIGAFFLGAAGVEMLVGGLVLYLVGKSGMEKHSPEAEANEHARAARERSERERVAREQREALEQEQQRESAERKREREQARRRDEAFALVKSAREAARADRCAATVELEAKIRDLDANVHDVWFVSDPDIKRCLAPSAPPPEPPPGHSAP